MLRVAFSLAPRAILFALSVLSVMHSPLAAARATLTISGSPPTTDSVGKAYSFTPTIAPATGSARFFISNKPAWAAFDSLTGRLSGTPTAAGTFSNIRIAVAWHRQYASLPLFTITVMNATPTNASPTISGSPATSVNAGDSYSFTPAANDPNNDTLTFSVQNRPSWASFNTSTGALSGTPTSADVGTYANVIISVSDGQASASLSPFSVAVNQTSNGSAQVSWTPPTANSDGSALTNLSGYRIYYGTVQTNLDKSVEISNPGLASYVVTNLSAGTWYFDVIAYTSSGAVSVPSNVESKTIQ
jgi:Putative Ig domain